MMRLIRRVIRPPMLKERNRKQVRPTDMVTSMTRSEADAGGRAGDKLLIKE